MKREIRFVDLPRRGLRERHQSARNAGPLFFRMS